jgi:hypothetical protein
MCERNLSYLGIYDTFHMKCLRTDYTSVFQHFFARCSPEFDLSVRPPPFVEVAAYQKELLYVHIVDVYVRIYL